MLGSMRPRSLPGSGQSRPGKVALSSHASSHRPRRAADQIYRSRHARSMAGPASLAPRAVRCYALAVETPRDIMKRSRRTFLHLAAGAAALPTLSRAAFAQAYPARPVRMIIGYPPGGSADITARLTG